MNFSLTRVRLTATVLLTLSVVVLALILLDVEGPLRELLVVAFGLYAPGWAVVACFAPMRPALEWSTSIAASLAVSVLLGTALLELGWRPTVGFMGLVGLTCCLLTVHLLRPTQRMIGILEVVDEMHVVEPAVGTVAGRTPRQDVPT